MYEVRFGDLVMDDFVTTVVNAGHWMEKQNRFYFISFSWWSGHYGKSGLIRPEVLTACNKTVQQPGNRERLNRDIRLYIFLPGKNPITPHAFTTQGGAQYSFKTVLAIEKNE